MPHLLELSQAGIVLFNFIIMQHFLKWAQVVLCNHHAMLVGMTIERHIAIQCDHHATLIGMCLVWHGVALWGQTCLNKPMPTLSGWNEPRLSWHYPIWPSFVGIIICWYGTIICDHHSKLVVMSFGCYSAVLWGHNWIWWSHSKGTWRPRLITKKVAWWPHST